LFLRRVADFGSFAVNAKKNSYSRFSIVPGRRNLLNGFPSHAPLAGRLPSLTRPEAHISRQ